jgi:hypothetical protein
MSAGPIALTAWLGLASIIVIGIIALIIVVANIAPAGTLATPKPSGKP